ncbi:dihydroxyacetone kinase subunit DhaL [Stomatohabitans albus]|uniref:dihydroxyacetone kinase subunit DhaL n=1 Tax=Stomatohabitans albus TaxID=3110766 RepID=UPI00300C6EE4
MTKLFNDPATFSDDMLVGFLDAFSPWVVGVPGGCIRAQAPAAGKVAVIVGGGSGHYPAFCGVVGPGYADGAVVGNVFTSPSATECYSVASAAHVGGGVLIMAGNYAGDVLNFDEARDRLRSEGIAAETLYITDDVASAGPDAIEQRRGIAGDCVVFKCASAAAEAGYNLDEVVRVAAKANTVTRSMGLGLDGCTLPGAPDALFHVPDGKMGVGLGIHGEPGISEEPLPSAREVADLLVDRCLAEAPATHSGRIAVILNGLGATKYEELFVVWGQVAKRLRDAGYTIVDPDVGELVTSLDMAGLSLTIAWLDDELEQFWRAPANTPAYRKGGIDLAGNRREVQATHTASSAVSKGSTAAQELANKAVEALDAIARTMRAHERELADLDTVAGDGDHGRGMVKGSTFALEAAQAARDHGAGIGGVMAAAGDAFGSRAGGTSGALWGAGLTAFGQVFDDQADSFDPSLAVTAIRAMRDAIQYRGGASLGDKTMLDALSPFVDALTAALPDKGLVTAWTDAATIATQAAESTAALRPKRGRARPLAERSLGHADPGATSMALALTAIASISTD